jgi:hypothetical protein
MRKVLNVIILLCFIVFIIKAGFFYTSSVDYFLLSCGFILLFLRDKYFKADREK